MPIVDDIVKGIKKFGDDVIEGAKNGPGKAARIKKGAIVMKSNGARVDLNSRLKNNAEDVKKIINRGRQDFDSLFIIFFTSSALFFNRLFKSTLGRF